MPLWHEGYFELVFVVVVDFYAVFKKLYTQESLRKFPFRGRHLLLWFTVHERQSLLYQEERIWMTRDTYHRSGLYWNLHYKQTLFHGSLSGWLILTGLCLHLTCFLSPEKDVLKITHWDVSGDLCFLSYLTSVQEVDNDGLKPLFVFLLLTYLLWQGSVLTKSSVEQREMSHIFLSYHI